MAKPTVRAVPRHQEQVQRVHPMIAKAAGMPATSVRPPVDERSVVPAVTPGDPAGVFVLILGALLMVVLTPVIALTIPTSGAGAFWGSLLAFVIFTNGANLAGAGARILDGTSTPKV